MKSGRYKMSGVSRGGAGALLVSACVLVVSLSAPAYAESAPQAAADTAAVPDKYKRSKLTSDVSEALADKRKILLATGEDRAVDLDFEVHGGANGISVGNPSVVATTLATINQKRQIIFKPLKEGTSTVTVRDPDGSIRLIFNVRVTGSNLLRLAGEIRELIRDIEGVTVRIVGKKIVIDGEVLVPNDYARLLGVIQDGSYAPDVLNLVTVSPFALQLLAKRIQEDIQAFAPNVKVRVVNGMIWLEGTVDSGELATRAESVASLYLPEVKPGNPLLIKDSTAVPIDRRKVIQNFIVINAPPPRKQEKLVRITMHFVELAKNYGKVFGFKWAPGFTSDPTITVGTTSTGGTGASGTSFTATISSLFPKLNSAQTAGYARILKTATVIVRSGQQAKLTDNVQFPQVTAGPNGPVNTGNITTGTELAVFPSILGQSEDIQLNIQVAQGNGVGRGLSGAPAGVASHKVETNLYIKSGESAALAGLQNSTVNTDFNKDDPASGGFQGGQTQPLFNLLASKNYSKNRSQFVIFVTPQIVENASDGTEDLKKNFRVRVK